MSEAISVIVMGIEARLIEAGGDRVIASAIRIVPKGWMAVVKYAAGPKKDKKRNLVFVEEWIFYQRKYAVAAASELIEKIRKIGADKLKGLVIEIGLTTC